MPAVWADQAARARIAAKFTDLMMFDLASVYSPGTVTTDGINAVTEYTVVVEDSPVAVKSLDAEGGDSREGVRSRYRALLPALTPVNVGDVLYVKRDDHTETLEGYYMTIVDVKPGAHAFTLTCTCVEFTPINSQGVTSAVFT